MSVNATPHATWLEIDLSAVEHNARTIIRQTGVDLLACVKNNAYGHGALECGKAALAGGAAWLAVARYNEAHALREAGITAPILVLGVLTPDEYTAGIAEDITFVLPSFEAADLISVCAARAGKSANVHMAIETGMGRLGVMEDDVVALARHLIELGNVNLDGVYSHFAMADFEDHPMMHSQLAHFDAALNHLHAAGIQPRWIHHANTGALLEQPAARYNLVRAGQGILGLNPYGYKGTPEAWRPALTAWKAHLISCKVLPKGWTVGYGAAYTLEQDEIIGVISAGFGDGIRRVMELDFLIGGQRVPMVGKTCMDLIMVKLPKPYPLNEEVVIVGRQGDEFISLEEFSTANGTVHVDITSLINPRVPRLFYRS